MRLTEFFPSRMLRPALLMTGILAGTLLLASCGAEAPTFEVGSIEVTSSPPGATIILDGVPTHFITPYTLTDLELTTHTVWVDHADFITRQEPARFDLVIDKNTAAAFDLTDTGIRVPGPAGARILVDGEDTGRVAPAGVVVDEAGPVTLSLELPGYLVLPGEVEVSVQTGMISELDAAAFAVRARKTVILEGFSNVSCPPCPELTDNLLAMAAKPEFSGDRVQFMEFAVSWPALNDPFFLSNPAEHAARYDLYQVFGAPDLYIDGSQLATTLDGAAMEAAVRAALDTDPGFLIDVTADFSAASVPVTVAIQPYQDVDFTGCGLYVAMYRKEVVVDPAPGLNGQTSFHHVFIDRVDSPPPLPEMMSAGTGESYELVLSNPSPEPDAFVAVAFIQHGTSLTVLQAGSTEVPPANLEGSPR